jgi:hypothetical protein
MALYANSFILVLFVFIFHVRNRIVLILPLLHMLPMCSFHYRCELIVQSRCLTDGNICRMYLLRVFSVVIDYHVLVIVITLYLSRWRNRKRFAPTKKPHILWQHKHKQHKEQNTKPGTSRVSMIFRQVWDIDVILWPS